MGNIICPVCDSKQLELQDKNYYNYELHTCLECGVVFCSPFKAPPEEFYSVASDVASIDRHTKITPWHKGHPSRNTQKLRNGAGKKLLDVGCGNGAFSEFASQNGFEVNGIDLDTASLNAAKQRKFDTKVELFKSNLVDFHTKYPNNKYDIITAFEVFEHLDNPKQILELISVMLKPNGFFIGSLPNFNRLLLKQINSEFERPPYHLTCWTTKSWQFVLESKYGFKQIFSKNNVAYNYTSYILKHKYLAKFNLEGKKTIGSFLIRTYYTLLSYIEVPLKKITNDGASFYFEFQKVK